MKGCYKSFTCAVGFKVFAFHQPSITLYWHKPRWIGKTVQLIINSYSYWFRTVSRFLDCQKRRYNLNRRETSVECPPKKAKTVRTTNIDKTVDREVYRWDHFQSKSRRTKKLRIKMPLHVALRQKVLSTWIGRSVWMQLIYWRPWQHWYVQSTWYSHGTTLSKEESVCEKVESFKLTFVVNNR